MLSYQVIKCYQLTGFRFLILPVQLTPFPVNSGLHVQLKEPLVLLQKALESQWCFSVSHSFMSAK